MNCFTPIKLPQTQKPSQSQSQPRVQTCTSKSMSKSSLSPPYPKTNTNEKYSENDFLQSNIFHSREEDSPLRLRLNFGKDDGNHDGGGGGDGRHEAATNTGKLFTDEEFQRFLYGTTLSLEQSHLDQDDLDGCHRRREKDGNIGNHGVSHDSYDGFHRLSGTVNEVTKRSLLGSAPNVLGPFSPSPLIQSSMTSNFKDSPFLPSSVRIQPRQVVGNDRSNDGDLPSTSFSTFTPIQQSDAGGAPPLTLPPSLITTNIHPSLRRGREDQLGEKAEEESKTRHRKRRYDEDEDEDRSKNEKDKAETRRKRRKESGGGGGSGRGLIRSIKSRFSSSNLLATASRNIQDEIKDRFFDRKPEFDIIGRVGQ